MITDYSKDVPEEYFEGNANVILTYKEQDFAEKMIREVYNMGYIDGQIALLREDIAKMKGSHEM